MHVLGAPLTDGACGSYDMLSDQDMGLTCYVILFILDCYLKGQGLFLAFESYS